MACRDMTKAEEAARDVRKQAEGVEGAGTVETIRLDLASLASVRQCAQELLQKLEKIHLLVNNAGTVTSGPELVQVASGYFQSGLLLFRVRRYIALFCSQGSWRVLRAKQRTDSRRSSV
jgi:NAD(P)-dependent dehydrogenase (short-subunit alcohol dehydrogenase family)